MKSGFGRLVMMVFIFGIGIGLAFAAGTAWGTVSGGAQTASAGASTTRLGAAQTGASAGADTTGRLGTMGTIEKIEGSVLTLTTSQGSAKVNISKDATILTQTRGTIDDLKAGVRVTASGDKQQDGSINATSIQIMPARSAEGTPTTTPGGRGEQREKRGG